jgi:hypothetical protein
MRFYELSLTKPRFVVEEAMNTEPYPIVTSTLHNVPNVRYPNSLTQRQRFLSAVATAEAARAAGSIPNPQYKEAKETVNRALETASDYNNRATTGWDYSERWNYSYPQLHTIAGIVKRLRSDDNPKVKAFVQEIAPLGELFAALKGIVSKRQPKATSDDPRDARYVPPPVTTIAAKKVHALLTDLMRDNFTGLVKAFVAGMERQLKAFTDAVDAAQAAGKPLSLYGYGKAHDGVDLNFLSRVTHDDRPRSMAVLVDDDAAAKIQAIATRDAEEIREMFVAKNLRKIVSIMDAKEHAGVALTEVKVTSRHISMGGFTGEFHAAFADGSSFDFTNSVVWSQSIHGRAFNRFPLTFHNVRLAGGIKMPRPSEERMNTVFIGVTPA